MKRLSENFLWGGNSSQSKIHLSKLEKISVPKKLGGWGLLDMRSFGRALLCKSLWRGIFGHGLWSLTIRKKYLQDKNLEFWYRRGSIEIRKGSDIWLSLRKVQQYFLENLRWNLFFGSRILIGIDSIVGGWECVFFPENLLIFLNRNGCFTWDKLISSWSSPIHYGKMATIFICQARCYRCVNQ